MRKYKKQLSIYAQKTYHKPTLKYVDRAYKLMRKIYEGK